MGLFKDKGWVCGTDTGTEKKIAADIAERQLLCRGQGLASGSIEI